MSPSPPTLDFVDCCAIANTLCNFRTFANAANGINKNTEIVSTQIKSCTRTKTHINANSYPHKAWNAIRFSRTKLGPTYFQHIGNGLIWLTAARHCGHGLMTPHTPHTTLQRHLKRAHELPTKMKLTHSCLLLCVRQGKPASSQHIPSPRRRSQKDRLTTIIQYRHTEIHRKTRK